MPQLIWPSKTPPQPVPAGLHLEAVTYPRSEGLPRGEGTPLAKTPNQLFLGDNLAVMSALLPEWEGRVDLIYADPPFFTNRRFNARVGRGEDSRKPQEWQLAEGYADSWADMDAYLDMLYPRLHLMHRLLSPTGTLYLHLDWHADAYARLLLDEIFGPEQLLNEIVWAYHGPSPIRSAFNRKHDLILAYTKGKDYTFNADAVRQPYDPNTVRTFAASAKAGFGKVPDLARGKVPEDWWYFPVVARLHSERTGYPTQKPEALLERIILASSNPGEVVADFFCGSGTTPLVAARLGRRYLASDITWRAVHTTRARLVELGREPFALLREAQQPPLLPEAPPAAFHEVRACLEGSTVRLHLNEPLPALDYWEVDPAWDGRTFHSIAQAVRPRRGKPIALHLTLPEPPPAGGQVALRLVAAGGEHSQLILLS